MMGFEGSPRRHSTALNRRSRPGEADSVTVVAQAASAGGTARGEAETRAEGTGARASLGRRRRMSSPLVIVISAFVVLTVANTIATRAFIEPQNIGPTLATMAPFVLAAVANTPAMMLAGIDISIGPLLGFINVALIVWLMPAGLSAPWVMIPLLLLIGAAVGCFNGVLVGYYRVPAIVATLGMYLFLSGFSVVLMPQPTGTVPTWLSDLAGNFGPIPGAVVLVGIPLVGWALFTRTRHYTYLLAVGDSEKTAFTSGLNVARIRILGYGIGGVFAAVAGLALSALVGSGDASLGPPYTLISIAAVVFGGTRMSGGQGSVTGSVFGALVIYLIESLMLATGLSAFWSNIAYGCLLLLALSISGAGTNWRRLWKS